MGWAPGRTPSTLPTPADKMKAEEERILREAKEQIERARADREAFERVVLKHNLCVICAPDPGEKPVVLPSNYERARTAAEIVIRTEGRPVPTKQLWEKVVARGINFLNGRTPESALAAYLHKYKKLQYLQGVGWWIAGVPWPPSPDLLQMLQQMRPAANSSAKPNDTSATNGYDTRHHRPYGRKRSPLTQLVLAKSAEILKGKIEPVRTGEIFRLLIEDGVQFPDTWEEPQIRVAGILRDGKSFRSHGRAGWTLIEGIEP
jgi:hypothetical protein